MSSTAIAGEEVLIGHDAAATEWLVDLAEPVTVPAGTEVVRQFHLAEFFYVLLEGKLVFEVRLEDGGAAFEVGETDQPWTPIGSSGLRAPGRYSTTVRTASETRLLRWRTADLWRQLYSDPTRAARFIEFITARGRSVLDAARGEIKPFPGAASVETLLPPNAQPHAAGFAFDGKAAEAAALLAMSPFFREFTDDERQFFAGIGRFILMHRGDCVLQEGEEADALYVLARGRIKLSFRRPGTGESITRTIGREGTVFNHCGVARGIPSPFTVAATRDTVLFRLPRQAIAEECAGNPEFAFVFAQRQLWLLGQFLLTARTRLISEKAENEILAVASLIDQKSTEIPVRSELYRVPALLHHPVTRPEAFHTLYRLVVEGAPLERSLAGLQIDILRGLERETRFTEKLAFNYERIVSADRSATRRALLDQSTEAMQQAFEEVPCVVQGVENLPQDGRFVAIYNHLACNAAYMLPNHFEFTLDSHFVSVLLRRNIGTPGLRVVKTSDSEEFWHRGYYGRILNLPVPEIGNSDSRQQFYDAARAALESGTPIVIAPEGTNNAQTNFTETSPGAFHAGSFVLARRMEPSVPVVPIALANFDRSVKDSVFAAVVMPPIDLAERIPDLDDRDAVDAFLKDFQAEFRSYVKQAAALAETARARRALPPGTISNLDRLDRMDTEFAGDIHNLEADVQRRDVPPRPVVFYGSSSFRLWEGVEADLALPDALNLAFGGSTLEACAHFFERIVVPHDPSALFIYAGDNDIGNGSAPEDIAERLSALLAKADQHLPGVPVCVLSIKPSPSREDRLADIRETNRLMRAVCEDRPGTRFVDIFHTMLRPDRRPDPELFTEDMLHMNAAGYARWIPVLRPVVTELARARARAGVLSAITAA